MTDTRRSNGRVSRREFLEVGGVGGAFTAATIAAVGFQESLAFAQRRWDRETDVLVAGGGAAASCAALFARENGADVIVAEKAAIFGGTSAKSAGIFWIPNNPKMREAGIRDPRTECLQYLARCAYPVQYNPADSRLGLAANEYELLEAFYDNGAGVIDELASTHRLEYSLMKGAEPDDPTGPVKIRPDYYAHLPENKAPRGRTLVPSREGRSGGALLMGQLKAAIDNRRIPVLLEHRVTRLVTNDTGAIIGAEATTAQRTVTIRARKAVIFGTGGFTGNPEMCQTFLRGPIFGGCGVPTNQGDFVQMGLAAGAQLANMNNAWWGPNILEQALQSRSVPGFMSAIPGDSMIQVNAAGRRVVNEKHSYHERGQAHFIWDPYRGAYTNLVLFMIYDQRCRERYGSTAGLILRPGLSAPYLLSGDTLEGLAAAIDRRLAEIAPRTGNIRLEKAFMENLKDTIARFNRWAETGVDLDFHRGETPVEVIYAQPRASDNTKPNFMMYPISATGPYYAVLLGGGTLDTKGGPKINARAQVLNLRGQPIPGLYGAGNCIGSPMGEGYHAGGATLGPAMTFGAIAGRNAAREAVKPETQRA